MVGAVHNLLKGEMKMAGPGNPLGRMTARKGGGNRRVRLWEIDSSNSATLKRLQNAYVKALAAIDSVEEHSKAIVGDPRFTEAGRKDELVKFAMGNAVPELFRGQQALRQARTELAERKAKLKLPAPDPGDVAAAFRRAEVRACLREMGEHKATAYIEKYAEKLPPEIAQAVLELPTEYSSLPPSTHQRLADEVLAAAHGAEIDAVRDLEQAIETTRSAIDGARDEVRLEVGIASAAEFNQMAAPFEDKVSVAWLRRGKVVDLERGVERDPTADELASGIEANSKDEFEAKRKAAA
jgi:hypothetical protein